ncbi:CD36 family protein [Brugia malayi]|nr:CD36 family protein [Brugia malayi]VIO92109.1 CD36 family protein [Brugia malayi]
MTVERQKCKLKTLYCRTARILLFIIGVILTLFGISMAFLAPHLINAKIYQQKNIARNNELYHLWENPDYKFSSEIFVYSVKNPQQVLDGNKPEMIKIGPYAYEMSLKKKILGFGNGSVKYQNVHNFTFDKNASCAECSPTREIWIPNIVFQKFVEIASNPVTTMAQLALPSQQPFLKVSVDDILFKGYEDPYLTNVCAIPLVDIICKSVLKVPKRIGFLMQRNGAQKIVEVTTGSNDGSGTAGEILSWDGLKSLPADWWNNKEARIINGTDGEFYKPLIKKTDIIYVFAPDLCRSIHLTFEKEIEYKNILAYRFTVKEDLLDPTIPGNEGFCHNNGKTFFSEDEKCSPKGLLDLSHCYNGTPPILFSFPNFLYADKRVKESVIGLSESSIEHDGIAIEVEPQTGTLLRTYIRSQINIGMWKGRGIIYQFAAADLSRMRNAIVPLFAEYQVVEIGNDSLALLRRMLLLVKEAFAFLCFIPISTGILLISIAISIELLLKTRVIKKLMRDNSNKVTVQVQSLPGN